MILRLLNLLAAAIPERYIFENGEKFHVTKNQDKNLKALDAGYNPNRFHEKRIKESWFEKQRKDGGLPKFDENGMYNSYKDYLVDVITDAKRVVSSFSEFEAFLSKHGIDIEQKSSKKKGDYLKYSVRSEYIYKKGSDNSKAVIKAPKTNNASIGEEKLSLWAGVDMGYTGIMTAFTEMDPVDEGSWNEDHEDYEDNHQDQPETSTLIPLDIDDSNSLKADPENTDSSFENKITSPSNNGILRRIKEELQQKEDIASQYESKLQKPFEPLQSPF